MPNRLSYELSGPGALTITVPNILISRAVEQDPTSRFLSRLAIHRKRHHLIPISTPGIDNSTQSFRLGLETLGNISANRNKQDVLTSITSTVGLLIRRVLRPEEDDEKLQVSAFQPTTSDHFMFNAWLDVPESEPTNVRQFVQQQMIEAASALQLYGHNTEKMLQTYPMVNFDYDVGIELRLSSRSSVRSTGGNHVTSGRHIGIVGEHVEKVGEPLVYLIGAVALAHADEYLIN